MVTDATESFTVESILEEFAEIPDPRGDINRVHLLGDIIAISVLAVVAGADGPKAIGVWAKSNSRWLEEMLSLTHAVSRRMTRLAAY
jgi:hypothetical protein